MTRRPAILLAAALTAALAAVLAAGVGLSARGGRGPDEPGRARVEALVDRAARALGQAEAEMAGAVARAASLVPLLAAVESGVDAATLEDLFETEDWWSPYRPHPVLLAVDGQPLAASPKAAASLADPGLLRAAERQGAAAAWVKGDAYLAAARRLPAGHARKFVLVLGRPAGALLATAVPGEGVTLVISDGRQPLAVHGPPLASEALGQLPGREASGLQAPAVGAARKLPSGSWVWAVVPATRPPAAVPFWLAGGLAALATALMVAGRRTSRRSDLAPTAGTAPAIVRALPDVADPAPTRASGAMPTMLSQDAQSFGRYQLVRRLGEGGMAEIFLAVVKGPEGFERWFVLKRLKPVLAASQEAVAHFIDEAKLGSKLVHSNIVPVLDFGRLGAGYYLATEYVAGCNAEQLLDRHLRLQGRPLPPRIALHIAHEVSQALAYAHGLRNERGEPLGIVHRDVSTANIMITPAGEVKLLDFGIAKSVERVSRTDFGGVKGNAAFMSPEQARGLAVDGRSDLFSLGLVLYACLTGESFYAGANTAELGYRAATGPTAAELRRVESLGPVIASVLSKTLALDPASRYAAADGFSADVAPLVAGARGQLAALMATLFSAEELARPQQVDPLSARDARL